MSSTCCFGDECINEVSLILSKLDCAQCLTASPRGARLENTSARGVAHVASQSFIPLQKPSCHLLASPLAQLLPVGLLLIPTLVSEDATQCCVRIANLSEEDCILPSCIPVVVLHADDGTKNDEGMHITTACNEMTITMEPTITEAMPPGTVPCPAFGGMDGQHARLQALLNKYANRFSKDNDDLGYMDAVQHCVHTTDEVPVAQPYRSIPLNQLQEVKEHVKGLQAWKIIMESHSPCAAHVVLVQKKDGSLTVRGL